MAKVLIVGPTVGIVTEAFRVGTKAAPLVDQDKGKAVTLADASQVNLAGADDEIFGFLSSIESGTTGGFKNGGVQVDNYAHVDTGALAVGDSVVVDANPASGTRGQTTVKKAVGATVFTWVVVHPGVIRRV